MGVEDYGASSQNTNLGATQHDGAIGSGNRKPATERTDKSAKV